MSHLSPAYQLVLMLAKALLYTALLAKCSSENTALAGDVSNPDGASEAPSDAENPAWTQGSQPERANSPTRMPPALTNRWCGSYCQGRQRRCAPSGRSMRLAF